MKKALIILFIFMIVFNIPIAVYMLDRELQRGTKGDDVYILQNRLRELGYVSFRPTGNFSNLTYDAVVNFQTNNALSVDGIVGNDAWTSIFSVDAKRVNINKTIPRIYGPSAIKQYPEFGYTASWSKLSPLFEVGSSIRIIDFNTSVEYYVTRTGGTNHADVEVTTAEDKALFLQCFKGYTWEKRPVLAEIKGNFYAASLFGTPNGNDTIIDNEMEGSLCLYFNGSTSDFGTLTDVEHQNNIIIASGQVR